MNAIAAFDTLTAARSLKAAGIQDAQAEAIAELVHQATALPDPTQFATKSDLAQLKAELLAAVETTKASIEAAKSGTIITILGGVSIIGSLLVAAAKLMH